MQNVKVSIIVPVYNADKYLNKCLKSIVSQTYKNIEIIAINDGSQDSSLAILQESAQKDSRIKIINKSNEGLSFAHRDGLSKASGEYVVFVDADDELTHDAISVMLEIAETNHVEVVVTNHVRTYGVYQKKGFMPSNFPLDQVVETPELFDQYYVSFFGKNIIPVNMWGKLYKMSAIKEAMTHTELFSDTMNFQGEDEYFNVKLFPYIHTLYMTDRPYYKYRYGGATCGYNKHIVDIFPFFDEREDLLKMHHYDIGYHFLYIEYVNYIYTELVQRIVYLHNSKEKIISFLHQEFCKRQIMKNIPLFYENKEAPQKMSPFIEKNYEAIYEEAIRLAKASKMRFLAKRILDFFL